MQESKTRPETWSESCTGMRMTPQMSPFIVEGAGVGVDVCRSLSRRGSPTLALSQLEER